MSEAGKGSRNKGPDSDVWEEEDLMRRLSGAILGMVCGVATVALSAGEPLDGKLLGYCLGQDVARNLRANGVEMDVEAFVSGLRDAWEGKPSRYPEEEFRSVMDRFQRMLMERQRERREKMASENAEKSKAFLEANRKKRGVKVTASGLQYRVLKKGGGARPTRASTVEVHYVGRLADGTEFDSSFRRGRPGRFRVEDVIPGWTEALLMMNAGSKWEIVVPPELGYGAGGGGPIPPNAVLVFEVELLSVSPPALPPER